MEDLGTVGKFIELYGFPALLASVTIILLIKYFKNKINVMNEDAQMAKEKANIELDLMKEQRMREMDRDDKITSLVMDVQTKQVEQLDKISENLNNMNKSINSYYYEVKNIHADIDDIGRIVSEIQQNTGETLIVVKENNKTVNEILSKTQDKDDENKKGDE